MPTTKQPVCRLCGQPVQQKCLFCGKPIEAPRLTANKSRTQKYCSSYCRLADWKRNRLKSEA